MSNAFGCQGDSGDAAHGVTGFIDFCQSDRQLQVSLSQKQATPFLLFRIKVPLYGRGKDCNFSLSLFAGRTGELQGKKQHKVTSVSVVILCNCYIYFRLHLLTVVWILYFQKHNLWCAVAAQPRCISVWTAACWSLCTAASWRRANTSKNHRRGGESRWAFFTQSFTYVPTERSSHIHKTAHYCLPKMCLLVMCKHLKSKNIKNFKSV